ncbi:4-hydroxy-tetrahydrodipicolinate synthase [Halobellus clavatus]|jgi:4-hydroxy-tetrahydrodipicolinate synthase|uniref:4-hydroxy-tetrahydrodipicolinate synthase n=1 Tax=Halobellus clavatus TaxID=660517 RepID=A0A1H3K623_9EURY|nr:4-hydroxy-tetrahydrodipicolinate synthase [Halobellus clavatus]SDY47657.1 4-hydroxy-tetrahydrodipicolinate synthase [Halobellus clavatus]
MTDIDFTGVFPAMTTPFDENEEIDHELLAADARRLEDAGVAGLVPAGSTGESATLTHDEHIEVVETVVEAVDDVPVIAGSGSNSTHEALDLSQRAADAGADALLLISPYYNKPEQAGLREHFRAIADAVDLPQIVYNVPGRTGQNVEPQTVEALASHENIRAYKAASGDIAQISEVIERTREEDLAVLSGDDALTLPVCTLGGRGVISVAGNVEPERTVELVDAAIEGDLDRAREVHYELSPLFRHLFVETNPIPVKAAMEIRGYGPSRVRSPLTDLEDDNYAEMERILAALEETPDPERTEAV